MKSYTGPKTEEVATLRLLLPNEVSNPYQGPFCLDLRPFTPWGVFNEALYDDLIPLFYNKAMTNDLNTCVFIEDLLKATFSVTVVDTNIDHHTEEKDVGRYISMPINWPIFY